MPSDTGDLPLLFQRQIASLTPAPSRWLIGHSGGLDSQVLLHLAVRYLPAGSVQVLHINHQLHPQAAQWAEFSAAQAKMLGVPHHNVTVQLQGRSENSAREGRYQVFTEQLQRDDCLLLGHHADDQAETLLFRLLRGSGLAGLAGIPVQRQLAAGQLYRPLLNMPRATLMAWAQAEGIDWVDDPSNAEDHYDRNFLRNQVMPQLASRWPGFVRRWTQTAQLMADSEQLLNSYLDQDLTSLQGGQGQLYFGRLPDAPERRRALIRRWLQHRAINPDLSQLRRIEAEMIGAAEDAQPQLRLGRWQLRRYRQQLFCLPAHPALMKPFEGALRLGEVELGDGRLEITATSSGLASLEGVQLVRRQGGEQLRPMGRHGHCSLKKLLQEHEIPPWQRQHWPLLVRDGDIVAVPGICLCENGYSESRGFRINWQPF